MAIAKKYWEPLFIALVLVLLFGYSLPTLTTRPRVSYDEGFFIEEAYNFEQYGKLDIVVAPNTFSELPHIANSSGFPGTIPLAGFFKLFGFGLVQARIYALIWMSFFLIVSYIFARKFFGIYSALFTILLLVTFPPFHENGRMAMGDIPGFTFLLLSLLTLNKKVFGSGILFGLSAISRPSVYVPGVISTFMQLVITKKVHSFRKIFFILLGIIPSVIISLILYLPESLTRIFWHNTILFLKTPTFGVNNAPGQNIVSNLQSFLTTQTLFYFLILFLIIVCGFFLKGRKEWNRELVWFSAIYGCFVLAYFLRSPGWFKYLLPLQFFIFFFLPSSVRMVGEYLWPVIQNHIWRIKISFTSVVSAALGLLILVQCVQLIFFADIFQSNDVQESMSYLSQELTSTTTVAFIHGSLTPLSVPIGQRYNFNVVNEKLFLGQNPLTLSPLPTIIVKPEGIETFSAQFQGEYAKKLAENYELEKHIGRLEIYKRK